MDFFDHQDRARKKTGRLVVLFALAVIGTVIATYVVVALFVGAAQQYTADRGGERVSERREVDWGEMLLRWDLLGYVGVGVLVVVGGGCLYKIAQLAGGGQVVALSMDGRLIQPYTRDADERKALNIVEEMAIASGTPVPPVYIIPESGINAFAAGYSPGDAVIGLTRGCIEQLNRDQLQGVVAHEFSHILNGDMRINVRLIGALHGILIVGMVGYFVFRAALNSGGASRKGNPLPFIALGASLMAVGFIGTMFGNAIKAAVSRQREYLADASAVQFTRNPEGISGALKVIGGLMPGQKLVGAEKVLRGDRKRSWLSSPNAPQASHMFFAEGLATLFATHPPIEDRIRRIDANYKYEEGDSPRSPGATASAVGRGEHAGVSGFASGTATLEPPLASSAGTVTEAHIAEAHNLLESLPRALADAAHEPYGARAVVYALLLDRDASMRQRQIQSLSTTADAGEMRELQGLIPHVQPLDKRHRLPAIELAIGTLRSLSPAHYKAFAENVRRVVAADEKVSLFEWVIQRIVLDHLDGHFQPRGGRGEESGLGFNEVRDDVTVLLSALAYAGHGSDDGAAGRAFQAAGRHVNTVMLLNRGECGLVRLDGAVRRLKGLRPQLKRRVLNAAAACVSADEKVTYAEAELFRAFASALGVPVPLILPGQLSA